MFTHPTFEVPDQREESDQEEAQHRPAYHEEQRLLHHHAGRQLGGLGPGVGGDDDALPGRHHLAPALLVPGVDQEGHGESGVHAGQLEGRLVAGHVPHQAPGLSQVDLEQGGV